MIYFSLTLDKQSGHLVRIDSDAVLWSSIFSDIIIQGKIVKFDWESDSKYIFY